MTVRIDKKVKKAGKSVEKMTSEGQEPWQTYVNIIISIHSYN